MKFSEGQNITNFEEVHMESGQSATTTYPPFFLKGDLTQVYKKTMILQCKFGTVTIKKVDWHKFRLMRRDPIKGDWIYHEQFPECLGKVTMDSNPNYFDYNKYDLAAGKFAPEPYPVGSSTFIAKSFAHLLLPGDILGYVFEINPALTPLAKVEKVFALNEPKLMFESVSALLRHIPNFYLMQYVLTENDTVEKVSAGKLLAYLTLEKKPEEETPALSLVPPVKLLINFDGVETEL